MKCDKCGTEAAPGNRFCGWCGACLPAEGSSAPELSGPMRVLDDLIADYRRELEGRPRDTSVLFNLASALERRGQHQEALAALRRLDGIQPLVDDVKAAIKRIEQRLG